MIRQLESRSLAVENLFAPPFLFASPAFQRPFAWTETEAGRLLEDLQAAAAVAPDDIYFIGAILLVRVPLPVDLPHRLPQASIFDGPERTFDIIDGLQRIATLAILLAVMRDLLGKAKGAASGVAPGGAGDIQARLQRALAMQAKRSARVLLRAPDGAFFDHITSETGACLVPPLTRASTEAQERLLDIRGYFLEQLQDLDQDALERLAGFVLANCSLVVVVTNAIDRAYHMFTVLNEAGKPLTRADILKAELIGSMPAAERAAAVEHWDDLARRLGSSFEQLFSFINSERRRGAQPILEAVRSQVTEQAGGARAYVFDILVPSGRIVDTILSANHVGAPQSATINDALRHLGWLPGQEWVPPLMAYWRRHAADPAALCIFLAALDRFAYGVRLLALGNDKRAQRMAAVADAIASGAPPRGPWAPLQFNRDELRNINFGLRDLHRRSPQICRLVLQRLEEQLSGKPFDASGRQWTVEHILPLKIPAQSEWKNDFVDADERRKLATCLGNLTLVSKDVNESAANHDFVRKHGIYFADRGEPVARLTDELRRVTTWTPASIEERLQRLTALFNETWQFDRS